MKRVMFFLVLIVLVGSLLADDLMQPAGPDKSLTSPRDASGFMYSSTRDRPAYEFIIDPTSIISTYYDYMPGSYCSLPLRIQPEISTPYSLPAGGAYVVFHSTETVSAERRVYYAYIDADGNVTATDPISTNDVTQGYAGIDIDAVTADPIVAWHARVEPDLSYDVLSSYDLFHMMGSPGLWIDEFISIDNPEAGFPTTGFDDEFIWPYVYISDSSPLGGDYRRVFVSGNNYTSSHGPEALPCESVLISYADFNTADLDAQSTLDWTYRTIAQLDAWSAEIPEWIRPFKGAAVQDNVIVYFGYNSNEEVFILVNENYGEGPFEYYSEEYLFDLWNPLNQAGNAYLYSDPNTPMTPWLLRQEIMHSGHMNVIFKDNNTKVTWMGSIGITFDKLDGSGPGYYYPEYCQVYPKEFVFDLNTHEFSFKDICIEGANPDDNIPMVPWDLDEDGVVDSFDPDGDPDWVFNWPIYWPEGGTPAFHYNNYKVAKNSNWMVSVWTDGTKAKRFYDGDASFAAWEAVPEIAIIISADYGATWSEPIFLNANETPELAGQIPCYVYPGDVIEIISNSPDDYHGKIHLFYLDDNDFGSYIQNNGQNNGGELMYAAIDVEFPGPNVVSTENYVIPAAGFLAQNYPNPFNPSGAGRSPSTTIKYEIKEAGNVSIEVFNIKGQKVKTLVSDYHAANNYSTVWNGTNDNNESVSSGIYFYKMKCGNHTSLKKMILLK